MKKTVSLVMSIILILTMSSCGLGKEYAERVIEGADSYATLKMAKTTLSGKRLSASDVDTIAEGCGRLIAKCDKLMCEDHEDSHLYALNNKVDMIVSPDYSLTSVMESALNISEVTGGAYSATAGGLYDLWKNGEPTEKEIKNALKHSSAKSLHISEEKLEKKDVDCKLDLSGIVEGFAAQRLLEYLTAAEVSYGIVSVGDSVGVFGDKKDGKDFKIGIKSPENGEIPLCYYHINGGFISLAASADRDRVVSPATGTLVDGEICSVAVWAWGGAVSDALSEALLVMNESEISKMYYSRNVNFEAILITDKKEIVITDGIEKGKLEMLDEAYTVREMIRGE